MNPRQLWRVALTLLCLTAVEVCTQTRARAELIGPGDSVAVFRETALKRGTNTLAVLHTGTQFTVQKVNGNWVSGTIWTLEQGSVSGWVKQTDVVKNRPGKRFAQGETNATNPGRYWLWTLARGVTQDIVVRSTGPVDVFIFTEEGKRSYDWAVNHSSGQAGSRWRQLNSREAILRWEPPTDEQFYLVVDNTNFPDGGANGASYVDVTTLFWQDDPRPAEPVAGRGLIIGRVTLAFDGYEGRHDRISRPMTVHIAHNTASDADDNFQITKVVTDERGYFALANLPVDHRYWVKAVEGSNFTAPVPFRVSQPISGASDDSHAAQTVLDLGTFALTVGQDGSMGVELESPGMVVSRKPGSESSELQMTSTARLDRHIWFLQSYASSGWASHVREDQARLEKERQEAASNSNTSA
jgi:hypothetical protein